MIKLLRWKKQKTHNSANWSNFKILKNGQYQGIDNINTFDLDVGMLLTLRSDIWFELWLTTTYMMSWQVFQPLHTLFL